MKKIMKQQSKRFPLWGFKGILSVALSSLGIIAFAQGAEVCAGSGYTIADAVPASTGSEYRWVENGKALAGTNQATYNVPTNKTAGVYTYVRQSKSAECPDWQSSNEFTVTVFACSFTAGTTTGSTATFTDSRDGKKYKTVVMPDGRTWFAQNLNYTKDLMFNQYAFEANGKSFLDRDPAAVDGAVAIGSYWCPGVTGSTYSGEQNTCNIYGALYTWETAMMVDGKYSDATKTNSAWDESWISPYYTYNIPGLSLYADHNNARGGTSVRGGGRGICPMGWHVPTIKEWITMLEIVDSDGAGHCFTNQAVNTYCGVDAGTKLKTDTTCLSPSLNDSWCETKPCEDQYEFAVIPVASIRDWRGYFIGSCTDALIATSTASTNYQRFQYHFISTNTGVALRYFWGASAYSVRCILDI
jgi:uncharacterized protein (TIGR02145 family)